jgi:hypothetical protein
VSLGLTSSPLITGRDRIARRWRTVGAVGTVVMALAATGVGDMPLTDVLGSWPSPWPQPRPWLAMVLAYLGLTLLVGAWWRLRSALRGLPGRLSFVLKTLGIWAAPLALAPPLYSRDVFSYLAQGAMYAGGIDPYRNGPASLGGALAANVSPIWQHAPAPYGPVFLAVASSVTSTTGWNTVLAVWGMRVVMLTALAVTTACLIPLARRFGVDPVDAIWLGVLNPLMLAHVVSGAHNDILILMLMTAGILLAVRRRPLLAAALLGLAVLIKAPAAVAIVVIVPSMARQLRGRYRMARGAVMVGVTALGTVLAVTFLMGAWYGWVAALTDTAKVRNGLSISTDAGVVLEAVTQVIGAKHVIDFVSVCRTLGMAVGVLLVWITLKRTRGRPLLALGLILSVVVLLGPVVHPWYLLWGIVPLAASSRDHRVISAVTVLSIGVAFYPMPWGEGFSPAALWGVLGTGLGVLIVRTLLRSDRALDDRDPPTPNAWQVARREPVIALRPLA